MNPSNAFLEQLLLRLPHKLQVKFALDCANDVKHLMTDPRSLKALEVTALWLEGKATEEEIAKASDAAANAAYYGVLSRPTIPHTAAHTAAYAASNAALVAYSFPAAYGASNDVNASNASYASYAADYAARALNIDIEHYKTKLLTEFLTDLEILLYFT